MKAMTRPSKYLRSPPHPAPWGPFTRVLASKYHQAIEALKDIRIIGLRARLLDLGGRDMVISYDPDLDLVLRYGRQWPARGAVTWEGLAHNCHGNASLIYLSDPARYQIVVGWALSGDDWYQHTWIWDRQERRVIETTVARDRYYGAALPPGKARSFAGANGHTFSPADIESFRQEGR